MPKIKVGDIVFYRNWRLGDEVFLARVTMVQRKKGLVTLEPFFGGYGHGWTWGGKPLPVIITTSMDIFEKEPVWLAADERFYEKDGVPVGETPTTSAILSELQEKLKGIGEGSPSSYDSLASIEEAEALIQSIKASKEDS